MYTYMQHESNEKNISMFYCRIENFSFLLIEGFNGWVIEIAHEDVLRMRFELRQNFPFQN